jgi:hypothetical protein
MLRSSPGGMQVNMRPSIASAWATRTMAERDGLGDQPKGHQE